MNDRQQSALLSSARRHLERTTQGHVQWLEEGRTGGHWRHALAALDELAADLKAPKVPDLGPVWRGGKSVLEHSGTHLTTGLGWPAFDDAFRQGEEIVAPEQLDVIPNPVTGAPWSSSNPGKAFYARGKSGLVYWFAHLDRNHAVGTKFRKGQFMGKVAENAIGGGPHVHVAIDARPLLGRHLKSKRWYQFGAPKIGVQLGKARA